MTNLWMRLTSGFIIITSLISMPISLLAQSGYYEDYHDYGWDRGWDSSWKQFVEWSIGNWSECSRTCGESFRYRAVQCFRNDIIPVNLDPSANTSLVLIDDVYCGEKPMDHKRCDTPPCSPEWVAEEWSQCDPWCGRIGFRTRVIRCMGGADTENPIVYPPHMCIASSRPPSVEMCNNGPCRHMTWDIGRWSKCSSYCGRGYQIRRVSCHSTYTGERVIPSSCHHKLRPPDRRRCKGTCQEGSGEGLQECQDNPTVRYCYLVLKFRLCNDDFFHEMCCVSCKARASYPFL